MDFINLNNTSLKQKEDYKPPNLFGIKENTKKRNKFQPGGDWVDNDEEVINTNNTPIKSNFNINNNNEEIVKEPVIEKKSKFGFINKKKSVVNESNNILTEGQIGNKEYDHHKKIIFEILQPSGASKKPSETQLSNFNKNCIPIEENVVISIILIALNDKEIEWTSKLRAFYALEMIIKNIKKYHKFLVMNKNSFLNIDISYIESINNSGYNNIKKIKEKIEFMLERSFGDFDSITLTNKINEIQSGIKINSKQEQMKNFMNKMNKNKVNNTTEPDFLNLNVEIENKKEEVKIEENDLLDLNFIENNTNQNKIENLDILNINNNENINNIEKIENEVKKADPFDFINF